MSRDSSDPFLPFHLFPFNPWFYSTNTPRSIRAGFRSIHSQYEATLAERGKKCRVNQECAQLRSSFLSLDHFLVRFMIFLPQVRLLVCVSYRRAIPHVVMNNAFFFLRVRAWVPGNCDILLNYSLSMPVASTTKGELGFRRMAGGGTRRLLICLCGAK